MEGCWHKEPRNKTKLTLKLVYDKGGNLMMVQLIKSTVIIIKPEGNKV